jgi:hypothetical protein
MERNESRNFLGETPDEQRRRIAANRSAWDVAIAAAHLMRQGITPPKHMMGFWEKPNA